MASDKAVSEGPVEGLMEILEKAGKSRGGALAGMTKFLEGENGDKCGQVCDQLRLKGEQFLQTTITQCWHDVQDVLEFCEGYIECEENDFDNNFEDILLREQACRSEMEQWQAQFKDILASFKTQIIEGSAALDETEGVSHEDLQTLKDDFTSSLRALIDTAADLGDFFGKVAASMHRVEELSSQEKPEEVRCKWKPTAESLAEVCRSFDRVLDIEAVSEDVDTSFP